MKTETLFLKAVITLMGVAAAAVCVFFVPSGLIVIGMVFVFAAFVIAVFAAVLQKLLHSALIIKSENDLTV